MSTEARWNWKPDHRSVKTGQLRLQIIDGRWTDLIFNPSSGEIERDAFLTEAGDVFELNSEGSISRLTKQFLGYARDSDYTTADQLGATVEPDFAWDLPTDDELSKARKRMSDKMYGRTRAWMTVIVILLIIWVAIVLFRSGNDIAPIVNLIPSDAPTSTSIPVTPPV